MLRRSKCSSLTRRELLALPFLAVAGGCSRTPYRREDFSVTAKSDVALFHARSYHADFSEVILRGLRELRLDLRGKKVLLKPNLVEYEQGNVINTHPTVIVGAADAMRRAGAASVVVAEGPGHRRDTEYLLSVTGLFDHLREQGIPFVDLNHDDVRTVRLRSWFTGERELLLPVSVLQADVVVSMPKLKTHHWAGMTCGMKNLFGVVPGAVYGWPKNPLHYWGIHRSIVDLAATIRPALTIVDGVVAMEGDGPIMGHPRQLGMVAMGGDVVAVDSECARVIGLESSRLDYLSTAGRFLGNMLPSRIEHRGEVPSRFATRFAVVDRLRSLQADPM